MRSAVPGTPIMPAPDNSSTASPSTRLRPFTGERAGCEGAAIGVARDEARDDEAIARMCALPRGKAFTARGPVDRHAEFAFAHDQHLARIEPLPACRRTAERAVQEVRGPDLAEAMDAGNV